MNIYLLRIVCRETAERKSLSEVAILRSGFRIQYAFVVSCLSEMDFIPVILHYLPITRC